MFNMGLFMGYLNIVLFMECFMLHISDKQIR